LWFRDFYTIVDQSIGVCKTLINTHKFEKNKKSIFYCYIDCMTIIPCFPNASLEFPGTLNIDWIYIEWSREFITKQLGNGL